MSGERRVFIQSAVFVSFNSVIDSDMEGADMTDQEIETEVREALMVVVREGLFSANGSSIENLNVTAIADVLSAPLQ